MSTESKQYERTPVYLFDLGGARCYSAGPDGSLQCSGADDVPEELCDGQDDGFYVFDGDVLNVRGWTEVQCDDADIPHTARQYDEWWKGRFREATPREVIAVFFPSASVDEVPA